MNKIKTKSTKNLSLPPLSVNTQNETSLVICNKSSLISPNILTEFMKAYNFQISKYFKLISENSAYKWIFQTKNLKFLNKNTTQFSAPTLPIFISFNQLFWNFFVQNLFFWIYWWNNYNYSRLLSSRSKFQMASIDQRSYTTLRNFSFHGKSTLKMQTKSVKLAALRCNIHKFKKVLVSCLTNKKWKQQTIVKTKQSKCDTR